jgi:hypothetical protein
MKWIAKIASIAKESKLSALMQRRGVFQWSIFGNFGISGNFLPALFLRYLNLSSGSGVASISVRVYS